MPEIAELIDSREIELTTQDARATLRYVVTGTHLDSQVLSTVKGSGGAPSTYSIDGVDVPRASIQIKPEHVEIDGNSGTGHWFVDVVYAFPSSTGGGGGETGTSVYNFDTGGGTTSMKQALAHVADYGGGTGTVPNHQGAIGVTKEGVEGVDITIPNYQFTETHYLAVADVNSATIASLTGCVNNSAFRGFAAGEVLFIGATGTKRANEEDWEINFRFTCSPNVSNQTIVSPLGDITIATKYGWDYLWVEYVDHYDGTQTVRAAKAAHVEQVYRFADLNGLPI